MDSKDHSFKVSGSISSWSSVKVRYSEPSKMPIASNQKFYQSVIVMRLWYENPKVMHGLWYLESFIYETVI